MSGKKFLLAVGLIGLYVGTSSSGVLSLANDDPDLFQANRILDVQLKLSDSDWRELRAQQPNPAAFTGGDASETNYTYFRGDLWIDGRAVENVGIRKKGFFGSNDGTRPSLKVKFDEYQKQQPWPDIDLLTLNNNKQDHSLLSQFLAYHVFRLAGLPAPRCNFARVTVNGKYLGVYTHVESIKTGGESR